MFTRHMNYLLRAWRAAMTKVRAVDEATKSVDIAEQMLQLARKIMDGQFVGDSKSTEEGEIKAIVRKMEALGRSPILGTSCTFPLSSSYCIGIKGIRRPSALFASDTAGRP